jgi:hypothetical protein
VPTRDQLRARPALTPAEADDAFELGARLQEADREADPARRRMDEGRVPRDELNVAEHFITDALARRARERHIAREREARPPSGLRPATVATVLVMLLALVSATALLVGMGRVKMAQRAASDAVQTLEPALLGPVLLVPQLAGLAGPTARTLDAQLGALKLAEDMPGRVVAAEQLVAAMNTILTSLPTAQDEAEEVRRRAIQLHLDQSSAQLAMAAREWRERHADWNLAVESSLGGAAVTLGLAEAP